MEFLRSAEALQSLESLKYTYNFHEYSIESLKSQVIDLPLSIERSFRS